MFSTAWELAKRHKGKIIAGAVLIGGAIAYTQTDSKQKTLESPLVHNELPNQARRHYIFDSTHRSCDQSITDLIPSLTSQIEARFDVEGIKSQLNNTSDMSKDEKLKLWNLLKQNVFSRIVASAYSFSILTLTLKAQISILAADTCAQMEKRTNQDTWRHYLPGSVASMIPSTSQSAGPTESPMEVGNRRIFLQCIQYFTINGLPRLMDMVAEAVEAELNFWPLTESRSKEFVRKLFDKIGSRIGSHGMITKLVAPLDSTSPDMNSCVVQLIKKLNNNLESTKSIETLNSLLDFYFSSALKMIPADEERLLKYIPALSNSYPILTSTAFDSPLFNSLYSSDIHQFAVHVFNS